MEPDISGNTYQLLIFFYVYIYLFVYVCITDLTVEY